MPSGTTAQEFLSKCLLFDLEARDDRIYRIGAVRGDEAFERKGRFDVERAVRDLDSFGSRAEYILGHNLLRHDLPLLFRRYPWLGLFRKRVVDTLFLSPLAFPENPYHRLVKDYKLVRESLSNPVADAKLASSVFCDQWESFSNMLKAGKERVLSLYRFCLKAPSLGGGLIEPGLADVFGVIGASPLQDVREIPALLESLLSGLVCQRALKRLAESIASDEARWPALAYSVAWLGVSGSNSVLPPWVRHQFPAVLEILGQLRDVPCSDHECAYCRAVHDPRKQLQDYFGFEHFREHPRSSETGGSLQEAIVERSMGDQPLLAIMPTGGGKSLCYQLPALVRHFRRGSLTIVITPLQALMKDQVDNLMAKTGSTAAAALNGLLTPPERGDVLERVRLGDVALLYVAPEQLRNRSFRKAIEQREIGCWVFDEAHCLSKWGHDFRPDYLYAGRFIREFAALQKASVPPVACFTATAKLDVKEEIVDYFQRELRQDLHVFDGSVERENLRFEVRMVSQGEKYPRVLDILNEKLSQDSGSALIYVATRNGAEKLAEYLKSQGWPAAAFHAGLTPPEKRLVQESFIRGEIRTICATNAFGMGIDKEDVRLVLHADIPGSLENYLQEAGRAGRDLKDAQCVLLYDEHDIETQFKLEAFSELTQRDIAMILRGLRKARRSEAGEVVITSGELLRDEDVETGFDQDDRMADTKVKTAVAWLERAGFLERDHNETRVFQGRPTVKSIEEARARMASLNLSEAVKRRWLAVLEQIMNAEPDEGLSVDELSGHAAYRGLRGGAGNGRGAGSLGAAEDQKTLSRGGGSESRTAVIGESTLQPGHDAEAQLVLRDLHSMSEAGLIERGLLLTAFVRHNVKNHSQLLFERLCALEDDMLKLMQEAAPDAASEGWLPLSLRELNQRLVDSGHEDANPEVLKMLLKSLHMDGRGLAGTRGSLELRQVQKDRYLIKLQRSWDALVATARKRRAVAKVALDTIMAKIPPNTPPSGELLVSFSSDDIARSIQANIYLAGQVKDTLAAIDRGLTFLNEQKVIVLQKGLAIFRQAMSIRVKPQSRGRRYTKSDFEPLHWHYRERVFQIHVMNEYARLGAEKIRQALELVLAYFAMDKTAFIKRYFPGRKEVIERATSQESYRRMVDELHHPVQMSIVAAPEDENMLVLAGPGSGKTKVVVHRCAYLLRVRRVPPASILVLCFNRYAALTVRRRLAELVGPEARGVLVLTYHALAMRLTGASFADLAEKGRVRAEKEGKEGSRIDFDALIPEALRLLRGEREVLGLDPDEVRDRLLAGYRHILVDEYQDVDGPQYELISALAGRAEQDRDRKPAILAVGDDDQNIYTFRGANVQFIRRFREDYGAKIHYLVENFRSTTNIIEASNRVIEHNRDRMKTRHPIQIDARRERESPGGRWSVLDPVSRGQVQVLEAEDGYHQAQVLVAEMLRLKSIDPHCSWSDFAVLARAREVLVPVRALCEHLSIPVIWGIGRDQLPPLHRIREIASFLELLRRRRKEIARGSELQALVRGGIDEPHRNPWLRLLDELLDSYAMETGDSELPVDHAIESIVEGLLELRREALPGSGVFLGTVHGAKGMEFPFVFVPDGGWQGGWNGRQVSENEARPEIEEERRVFYVAMTRAREMLSIFRRKDAVNPFTRELGEQMVIHRPSTGAGSQVEPGAGESFAARRFETLGMQDMFLDFAGRRSERDPIHEHLAALEPGAILSPKVSSNRVELLDSQGRLVALLSHSASQRWLPLLERIEAVRVVGMIVRKSEDSGEEFKSALRSSRWEIPWVEVIYR